MMYSAQDSVLTHFLLHLITAHRKGILHNSKKEGYNLWLAFDGDNDTFSFKICVRQSYS